MSLLAGIAIFVGRAGNLVVKYIVHIYVDAIAAAS